MLLTVLPSLLQHLTELFMFCRSKFTQARTLQSQRTSGGWPCNQARSSTVMARALMGASDVGHVAEKQPERYVQMTVELESKKR